jgi:hypothetical protein
MTAGFCWKWSKEPKGDGGLEMDVKIGDYERPWNARHDSTRLAKGPFVGLRSGGGIDQIGCVYTAQGVCSG